MGDKLKRLISGYSRLETIGSATTEEEYVRRKALYEEIRGLVNAEGGSFMKMEAICPHPPSRGFTSLAEQEMIDFDSEIAGLTDGD